ncbi:hypothetical protein QTP88_005997 [Uroleucon formosanum]
MMPHVYTVENLTLHQKVVNHGSNVVDVLNGPINSVLILKTRQSLKSSDQSRQATQGPLSLKTGATRVTLTIDFKIYSSQMLTSKRANLRTSCGNQVNNYLVDFKIL